MDKITHEMRLKNWSHVIEECNNRPEGVTVHQWLLDNEINEKVYYYWLRRVRKAAYDQMQPAKANDLAVVKSDTVSYAEITLANPVPTASVNKPAVVISKGDVSIDISEQVSEEFLVKLLRAMKHVG